MQEENLELKNINDSINVSDPLQTIEQLKEKQENVSFIDFKMVTFDLAGKDYGIDIMHVKEIAKASHFTYVPNTLPFVLGVYNLRGEIIPILDLRIFFNIPVEKTDREAIHNLLILSIDDQIFGLVVDKIDKVIGVQKSTIQPPHPLFGDINIKYINGVVENNNRLYVLLDVLRIFPTKDNSQSKLDAEEYYKKTSAANNSINNSLATQNDSLQENNINQTQSIEHSREHLEDSSIANSSTTEQNTNSFEQETFAQEQKTDNRLTDFESNKKFITDSLVQYANFYVTSLNESFVKARYNEWVQEKSSSQISSEEEAKEYLSSFWSSYTNTWWSNEYAKNVEDTLPDNLAKNIIVWNPGCAKGIESYSLACILKEKYPNALIKIYAQDIDLLNVSNAALMAVPESLKDTWYAPYLTQKANGEYTFSSEIKDCIMFEYHDFKNTNILPMVDVIFARDVLSLCNEVEQNQIIMDFQDKMKGNAIVVVGDNELISKEFGFSEKTCNTIKVYTKD